MEDNAGPSCSRIRVCLSKSASSPSSEDSFRVITTNLEQVSQGSTWAAQTPMTVSELTKFYQPAVTVDGLENTTQMVQLETPTETPLKPIDQIVKTLIYRFGKDKVIVDETGDSGSKSVCVPSENVRVQLSEGDTPKISVSCSSSSSLAEILHLLKRA